MRYPIPLLLLALPASIVSANDVLEEIKVTAHPLAEGGVAQSTSVLAGDDLAQKIQGSLGETVAGEVGIQSASFGTAVGRPVIHGLGGPRVKTTEDRIDSLDVSVTSTDHAVTVEPFIADRITVLKGASTLLYGSGAIGGVVDVETGRVPKELSEDINGRLEVRAADNADSTVAAGRLDGSVGQVAWHIDAFDRSADDYDIPGFVESQQLRDQEELESDGEEEAEEERDLLEGSFSRNRGGAVGLSFIGDQGFVGVSVSTIDAQYGLVGGHGHEEEHEHDDEDEHDEEHEDEHGHEEGEEEAPGMINLEQTRFDIEAQLQNPFSGINSVNFRLGVNDYEHQEIEGNGEIGTLFDNQAWEARLQFEHAEIAGFNGSFGLQASEREFSALGEEAFVPPVESETVGVFWLGERELQGFDLELGVRLEDVTHQPSAADLQEVSFTTASASLGLVSELNSNVSLAALLDYSSRAPSIEELFSNGPHLATASFEVGNPDLKEESALALSFTAGYQSERWDIRATLYANEFSDFIYELGTGEIDDDLPVFVYQQDDARFIGLDLEAIAHLGIWNGGDFDLEFKADTVDAKLKGSANDRLPRIPASRVSIGASWQSTDWELKATYQNVSSQTETARFELPTSGYDDLSVYVARKLGTKENSMTLFFHGRNLTDEEQRHHASFVKEFAPAPGRRMEVGIRWSF